MADDHMWNMKLVPHIESLLIIPNSRVNVANELVNIGMDAQGRHDLYYG